MFVIFLFQPLLWVGQPLRKLEFYRKIFLFSRVSSARTWNAAKILPENTGAAIRIYSRQQYAIRIRNVLEPCKKVLIYRKNGKKGQ
jgi:hypothetical protein